MPPLDVEIDTVLREKALQAVEAFVCQHGTPVSRTQIAGLMQVASNEPSLLSRFAGSQKNRAEKRAAGPKTELTAEIAFWALVQSLGEGKGAKCPWSLLQEREAALQHRPDLHLDKLPPGALLSREDRDRRDQKRRDREAWVRSWDREHYPGFFRHFCAHYVFRMPPEKR
jgi:hypothetical protein